MAVATTTTTMIIMMIMMSRSGRRWHSAVEGGAFERTGKEPPQTAAAAAAGLAGGISAEADGRRKEMEGIRSRATSIGGESRWCMDDGNKGIDRTKVTDDKRTNGW